MWLVTSNCHTLAGILTFHFSFIVDYDAGIVFEIYEDAVFSSYRFPLPYDDRRHDYKHPRWLRANWLKCQTSLVFTDTMGQTIPIFLLDTPFKSHTQNIVRWEFCETRVFLHIQYKKKQIISEAYCSSWLVSNMFIVAEIRGWNNYISVSDLVTWNKTLK